MATPRQTQHRQQREARQQRRALAEVKRAFHQSQATSKRLVEALGRSSRPRVAQVVEGESLAPTKPVSPKNPCPQCGDELRQVELGRITMVVCPTCKWHPPAKS